ncbi:MAG: cyclic nucleotide-binding domain-containing protein [Actinomycetota bacterium]
MGVGKVAAELSKVPLFSGCSQRELQVVARAVREINHRAGTVIAREGEPGIGLFVVTEGTASVTIGGLKKGTIRPGEFFGEIALLDGGPRTATVTADTDVKLLGLTEWVFRGLVRQNPSIAIKTLQAMAARLRTATKAATV